jgi:hypothetical protein
MSGPERLCFAGLLHRVSACLGVASNCASGMASRTGAVGIVGSHLVGGRQCSDGSWHYGFGAHGGARGGWCRRRAKVTMAETGSGAMSSRG